MNLSPPSQSISNLSPAGKPHSLSKFSSPITKTYSLVSTAEEYSDNEPGVTLARREEDVSSEYTQTYEKAVDFLHEMEMDIACPEPTRRPRVWSAQVGEILTSKKYQDKNDIQSAGLKFLRNYTTTLKSQQSQEESSEEFGLKLVKESSLMARRRTNLSLKKADSCF